MPASAVELKQDASATGDGYTPKRVPEEVKRSLEQAVRQIAPLEPEWQEALAFFDNDQWVERSAANGSLQRVENRDGSAAKPRWRSRMTRNRYTSAILKEKSALIARVPVPECSAPSGNPEAINAAKTSEKACTAAYYKLGVQQIVDDVLVYALNAGAGYAWPYWNSGVGKFLTDPMTGKVLREGEIGCWVLGPSDVLYEHGVQFNDSRWYCVRRAQPIAQVMAWEDYDGPPKLVPDSVSAPNERPGSAPNETLVFVYHYLERPSKKDQRGRHLKIANGQLIAPVDVYPCDEDVPVLHAIEDIRRPHRIRPMGRGQLMLDIQRTYNRTINQINQWKNAVLFPTILAPKGSIKTRRTGEPNEVVEYIPKGGQAPTFREVPEIPMSLFRVLDQCVADWQEITGQHQIPAGVESGSAIAGLNERDDSIRASLVASLAAFYGSFFQHVLYLMQRHYTEPRLLELPTRFGTESMRDFLGAKLMPGISVRVLPGSIEPRTRAAQEAKIIMYAERGWLAPHQVMAALRSGNADSIIDDFELDVAKANREIQQLMAMGRGEGLGPVFAGPADNHQVHKDVIGAWMKTEDFERQDELVKRAALAHYRQHDVEFVIQQLENQASMNNAAAQAGEMNAAGATGTEATAGDTNLTSLPGLEGTVRGLQGAPAPA